MWTYGRDMSRVPSRNVMIWSGDISLLVVAAGIAGLADPAVYAQETPNWTTQAQGQDLANLLAVVVLLIAAVKYRNGAHRHRGLVPRPVAHRTDPRLAHRICTNQPHRGRAASEPRFGGRDTDRHLGRSCIGLRALRQPDDFSGPRGTSRPVS